MSIVSRCGTRSTTNRNARLLLIHFWKWGVGENCFCVCEVKSSAAALSFNERLRTDARALDSALRWSGLIPPEQLKETVDRLLPLLQDGATLDEARTGVEVDGVRIRALLCCPSCESEPDPPRWCIRGAATLDYINRCLNPLAPRERSYNAALVQALGRFPCLGGHPNPAINRHLKSRH